MPFAAPFVPQGKQGKTTRRYTEMEQADLAGYCWLRTWLPKVGDVAMGWARLRPNPAF